MDENLRMVLRQKVQKHEDGTVERWRDVPTHKGLYRISDWGRVKSLSRFYLRSGTRGVKAWIKGRLLRTRPGPEGYHLAALYDQDGVRTNPGVHRLVLLAFFGPCPDGMECRHLNGDPSNNYLDNLAWGTPLEQAADRVRHGNGHRETARKGEDIPWSKFTERDIRRIRRQYNSRLMSQGQLAREYGVNQSYISRIVRRLVWSHVDD